MLDVAVLRESFNSSTVSDPRFDPDPGSASRYISVVLSVSAAEVVVAVAEQSFRLVWLVYVLVSYPFLPMSRTDLHRIDFRHSLKLPQEYF